MKSHEEYFIEHSDKLLVHLLLTLIVLKTMYIVALNVKNVKTGEQLVLFDFKIFKQMKLILENSQKLNQTYQYLHKKSN